MDRQCVVVGLGTCFLTVLLLYEPGASRDAMTCMDIMTELGALHAMSQANRAPTPATGFLTSEQRAQRLAVLQKKLDSATPMSPAETQEAIIDFALTRSADLLQGFADVVGARIAEKNRDAGEGFKRLPGSLAESAYTLYLTSKVVLTKAYINDVGTLLRSSRCFKKSARGRPECAGYTTSAQVISTITKNMTKVVRPLLEALLLGSVARDAITNEDRTLRGLVPVAVDVIGHGTDFQQDLTVVVDLLRVLLNMADALADRYART